MNRTDTRKPATPRRLSRGEQEALDNGYTAEHYRMVARSMQAERDKLRSDRARLLAALREVRTTTLDRACVPIINEVLRDLGED